MTEDAHAEATTEFVDVVETSYVAVENGVRRERMPEPPADTEPTRGFFNTRASLTYHGPDGDTVEIPPEGIAALLESLGAERAGGDDSSVVQITLTPDKVVALFNGLSAVAEAVRAKEAADAEGAKKARHRTHSPVLSGVDTNIDPVSNAVMGRHGKHAIGPEAYWIDGGVKIPTGSGGHATISLTPRKDVPVDAPYRTYQLNERDRYWYDHASTLFFAGQTEVTGAQILGLCGYSNPYADNMISTMKEAMESFLKGNRTLIAIDTTEEKRNARRKNVNVISSITARQVVGAELSIETIVGNDGEVFKDFTLSLRGKTPEEAFPISAYARSRDMLTTIGRGEYTFKNVSPSIDAKQAWYYLIRCLHHKKRSNTVRFETMWQDLELPEPTVSDEKKDGTKRTPAEMDAARKDAARKKRERLRKQLERMLDEAMENKVIDSWQLSTDKKTGKPNGFKITPIEMEPQGRSSARLGRRGNP